MSAGKHRSKAASGRLLGFSVSYQRETTLARGVGVEHLRELILGIARPVLRHGGSIAYGGAWRDDDTSFTYPLLRLVSAEQEENAIGGPDTSRTINPLVNHVAWPYYLAITPYLEAQWIGSCRVVRVTQDDAGIPHEAQCDDAEAGTASLRSKLATAISLSAMRRIAVRGTAISAPGVPSITVPPIGFQIVLGGKATGYDGFVPGVFEEALCALEASTPLVVLGGFGGPAEVIASVLLRPGEARPPELTLAWHLERNESLQALNDAANALRPALTVRATAELLDSTYGALVAAAGNLSALTGLRDEQARELLTTRDPRRAMKLVQSVLQLG
jgi:hypothetical protein